VASTFRLSFPSAATVEDADGGRGVRAGCRARARTLRCLVVDDEEAVRTVLGDVRRVRRPPTPTMVGGGAEAIERFSRRGLRTWWLTDLAHAARLPAGRSRAAP